MSFDGPAYGLLLISCVIISAGLLASRADADDGPANAAAKKSGSVFARRIVLKGAATPTFERDLKTVLRECQRKAVDNDNGRDSILVLEIHGGPSSFGHVWGIGRLLKSSDYSRVRTVAWIPKNEKVTRNNAIVALACHDIVMHPDASLGDIGGGKKADEVVWFYVKRLVDAKHNPELQWELAQAMMDPQIAIMKVTVIETKNGVRTPHDKIVTAEGLRKLRADKAEIPDEPVTIKHAGEVGTFTGSKASSDNILIRRTAKNLEDLATSVLQIPTRLLHKPTASSGGKKRVALIRIREEITPLLESFLIRQIDRCEQSETNLIIFEITSPGGLLLPTMTLADRIADLDPEQIRTVAYIPRQALSGAAILALACDEIYLRPGAVIGNAGPKQFEQASQEVLDPLKAKLRDLAKRKHRPPALLEAMADKNLLVYRVTHKNDPDRVSYMSETELNAAGGKWIKGPIVPESEEDKLLTLTGLRAVELQLADGVIEGNSEEEQMRALKASLGLPPDMKLVAMERTWVDTLVYWLNNDYISVLLIVVAVICIYVELNTMTGFFGIISALCFSLFFWSKFLGGTAGWLEIVLFLLGLGCIAMEIFVMPGFGVFGISGGLLVISSLVLASQTFGNIEPNADFHLLARTMGKLAITVVLVAVIAMAISRFLPHVPLLSRMVLAPPGHVESASEVGPQLRPEYVDENAALVGRRGAAVSTLRPAGKARFGDRMVDVVSNGPYIPADSPVEVVSVSGNRIVVRGV